MRPEGGGLEQVLDLVAHDLRNPLSAILTAAEVLRRRDDLSEGSIRTIERLQSSAERMATMVNQLDDWARCQLVGGVEVERSAGDVQMLCRELVDELPRAEAARIELVQAGDGSGRWDAERLTQLLGTLVANAFDHGDPQAPVRIVVGADEKSVRVEVHNQGPPVAADLLPLLFDPVARRRAQRPTRARGLGFGLWLARAIAVAHGGTLTARSSVEGITFTLQLPR